jgi:hypothetical protein
VCAQHRAASARGPAKWPGLTSVFTGLPAAAGELYFMHDKQGGRQMHIERKLPLVEEILDSFSGVIGADLPAYRNHVYRVINLCLSSSLSDYFAIHGIIAPCPAKR